MIDIGESFKFVFRDPNWFLKLFIGALFTLLSVVLIGIPVIYGYRIEMLKRVRRGDEYPLPEWKDVGVYFITGFKYLVTMIIYLLPLLILVIPFVGMMVVLLLHGTAPDELSGVPPLVTLSFLGIGVYSLFILIISPVIAIHYSARERIAEGLQVGVVMNSFKQHWQDVLTVVVLGIALDILSVAGIFAFMVGILFTSFYVKLVQFHFYGQLARTFSTPDTPL